MSVPVGTIRVRIDGRVLDCAWADPQDRESHRIHALYSNRYVIMARADAPDARRRGLGLGERLARLLVPDFEAGRTILARLLRAWFTRPVQAYGNYGLMIRLHGFDPDAMSYPVMLGPDRFALVYHDLDRTFDELRSGSLIVERWSDRVIRGTFSGILRNRSGSEATVELADGAFAIRLDPPRP